MAVTENNVLMTGVDSSGNKKLLYPVTTLDAVEGAEKLVRVDESQSFTATEKTQARANIGAASADHTHTPASIGAAASGHSHSYNDLTDKPTIPAAYTHPSSHPASMITGLATVATSGKYSDLSGKPTIPTIPASLPANGGNADTVDGKHAADFAAASHTHDYAASGHTHTPASIGAAPTSHASSATTYGVSTAANYGHSKASSTTPKAPGTAAVGSETAAFARGDHVHPLQMIEKGVTTAGTGAAYTATVEGITALATGVAFLMVPHTTSTAVLPTLNVNGLGAKAIRRRVSNSTVTTVPSVSTNWLYANKPIRVTFDGTYWIADMDRPNAADIYGTVPVANGGVPAPASTDEGKFLRVVSGVAAWATVPNAEEASF